MVSKFLISGLSFSLALAAPTATAEPQVVAAATSISCLVKDTAYKGAYQMENASSTQRAQISRVVNSMVKDNPKLKAQIDKIKFVVTSGDVTTSNQTAGTLVAAKTSGNTITLRANMIETAPGAGYIAHEICHILAKSPCTGGAGSNMSNYTRQVPEERCAVSTYSTDVFKADGTKVKESSRGEEFAEACSAFIVAPNLLTSKAKDPQSPCGKALTAVKQTFGGREPTACTGFDSKTYYKPVGGAPIQTPAYPGFDLFSSFEGAIDKIELMNMKDLYKDDEGMETDPQVEPNLENYDPDAPAEAQREKTTLQGD